jgi:hypothetical protein
MMHLHMEIWLIPIDQGVIEICRSPNSEGYRDRRNCIGEEQVSHTVFPEFTIVVRDLINIQILCQHSAGFRKSGMSSLMFVLGIFISISAVME